MLDGLRSALQASNRQLEEAGSTWFRHPPEVSKSNEAATPRSGYLTVRAPLKAKRDELALGSDPDHLVRFVDCGALTMKLSANMDTAGRATSEVDRRANDAQKLLPELLGKPC